MNEGLLDVLRTVHEGNPQYAQVIKGLISFSAIFYPSL